MNAAGLVAEAPKYRILFVDDEEPVLDGLRNLLRRQRHEWDMVFAVGSAAGLAQVEQHPFDVVISDMRMPGMNGAELLERVRDVQPRAARIVLSGYSEQESFLRALPVAHQLLAKPCEADELKAVIARTCAVQAILANDRMRELVGRLDRLPSPPRSYGELTRLCNDPNADLDSISKIIEQDPAMASRVLQLVNSAYFSLPSRTSSVPRAISFLGISLLRGIALTAQLFDQVEKQAVAGFSTAETQQHSLLVARIAKRIVRDPKDAETAFTAALLHDVGKLVLAFALPEQYAAAIAAAASGEAFAERTRFGIGHAELGAYLLGSWGLPVSIVDAVGDHHNVHLRDEVSPVLLAVHIADALVHTRSISKAERGPTAPLDEALLDRLGLTSDVPRLQAIADQEERKIEDNQ